MNIGQFHVAGIIAGNKKINSKYAKVGDEISLVREPENQYDPNAVQCVTVGSESRVLGYVPAYISQVLAPILDAENFAYGVVVYNAHLAKGDNFYGIIVDLYVDEPTQELIEEMKVADATHRGKKERAELERLQKETNSVI